MNKVKLRNEGIKGLGLYWGELGDGHDGWIVRVLNNEPGRKPRKYEEPWQLDILEQKVLNPGGQWIGDYHAKELRLVARYADGRLHEALAQARYEKLGDAQRVLNRMAELLEGYKAEGRKVGDWGIREVLRQAEGQIRDEDAAEWEKEMAPVLARWNDPEHQAMIRRNQELLAKIKAERAERARQRKNRRARERRAEAKEA